jgi:protein dithiol oxidoreductase (disulfide-forming)
MNLIKLFISFVFLTNSTFVLALNNFINDTSYNQFDIYYINSDEEQIDSRSLRSGSSTFRPALRPQYEPGNPEQTQIKLDILIEGLDYRKLDTPQRTSADKNTREVIFFFYFESPWSQEAWVEFEKWTKENNSNVKFIASPAILDDSWAYGARVFFTLEQLGYPDAYPRLSSALSSGEIDYYKPKSFLEWLRQFPGLTNKMFKDTINSPLVIAKTNLVPDVMISYNVVTVPTIVIDGEYVLSARTDLSPKEVVKNAKFMVEQLNRGGPRP